MIGLTQDEHPTLFVRGETACVDEFGFHILDIFVAQLIAPLQRTIRNAPLALEQGSDIGQKVIEFQ